MTALTGCGRPIVGSNGCETIIVRLIDVRKKSVVTRSVPLGDLWPACCWDRTGVDVVVFIIRTNVFCILSIDQGKL